MRLVLVAAKELAFAKSRLRSHFPAGQRKLLALAMFGDVLAAALAARRADRVAVVSSDREVLEQAKAEGAIAIDEEYPRGLNAAVSLATRALMAGGAKTVCTVLSDVPLVSGGDIDAVFEAGVEAEVVLVPSRDLTGTNLILRTPPDVIATRFGTASLGRHLEECRRLGVRSEVLRLARPALDLDVVADLQELLRIGGAAQTLSQLARLGLASA